MSDTSKLPTLNNQSKSNEESTINHDNQVHPNIEFKTDPNMDKMIQVMDNPDKAKISNSKSQEGNSSYLQLNKSIDNENTEVQTELKLPTTEEDVTKKSDIEKPNHSSSVSIKKDDIINTKLSDSSKISNKNSNPYLIKSPNLKQHILQVLWNKIQYLHPVQCKMKIS